MCSDPDRPALPTQEQVAYRALCLAALVGRGRFEEYVGHPDMVERAREMDADLRAWAEAEGVAPRLSGVERALLEKPLGCWSVVERTNAGWRAEALGAMLWALRVFPVLPPYDEPFPTGLALEATGMYDFAPAARLLGRARLRPAEQVRDARDAAELWHWRARASDMAARGVALPDGRGWPENIAGAAETAHRAGWAPPPLHGDFLAFGKPYSQLSREERWEAGSIAYERHHALIWLCGEADDWDHVPIDT